MIEGIIIKQIAKNTDQRGWLAEFYRQDEINFRPAMAYISITKPGVIRGPHEHKIQTDGFVFIGPGDFELHLWDGRENSPTKGEYIKLLVGENNPVFLIVPPGVVHGYKNISEVDAQCINIPDKLYRGVGKKEEVDEIRWEDNKEGKFKIN